MHMALCNKLQQQSTHSNCRDTINRDSATRIEPFLESTRLKEDIKREFEVFSLQLQTLGFFAIAPFT